MFCVTLIPRSNNVFVINTSAPKPLEVATSNLAGV